MGKIKVGINGFGRIGRTTAKLLMGRDGVELAGINDPAELPTLAHLLKYDSVHGPYPGIVSTDGDELLLDEERIPVFHDAEPGRIPWKKLEVDVVIEATGQFLTRETAEGHLQAGASRVILSAPPKDREVPMIVLGTNDELLDEGHSIVSNASCTTNSAAPIVQLVDRLAGIESGYITTVHSYTMDQRLHDAPHKDLRRARAAAESIVPTTTGAAKAITRVFPHLDLKMGGCGIRVPVPDGSLTDITCVVSRPPSLDELDQLFREEAEGGLKGVLRYNPDPIVSRDIIGDPHSCIYDSELSSVIGNLVKVVGWYDNEMGYSSRLVDLVERMK